MKLSKFIENQTELVEALADFDSVTEEQIIYGNELSKFIADINENISNESLDLLEKQIMVIKKSRQYEAEIEKAFNKTFGDMRELEDHRYDKKYVGELLDTYYSRLELLGICGDLTYEDDWWIFYKNPNIELMDKELVRLDKEIENFRKEFPNIVEAYKDLDR